MLRAFHIPSFIWVLQLGLTRCSSAESATAPSCGFNAVASWCRFFSRSYFRSYEEYRIVNTNTCQLRQLFIALRASLYRWPKGTFTKGIKSAKKPDKMSPSLFRPSYFVGCCRGKKFAILNRPTISIDLKHRWRISTLYSYQQIWVYTEIMSVPLKHVGRLSEVYTHCISASTRSFGGFATVCLSF